MLSCVTEFFAVQLRTFFLTATSVQSNVEKSAPQTAKLPPILGASRLIAYKHTDSLTYCL